MILPEKWPNHKLARKKLSQSLFWDRQATDIAFVQMTQVSNMSWAWALTWNFTQSSTCNPKFSQSCHKLLKQSMLIHKQNVLYNTDSSTLSHMITLYIEILTHSPTPHAAYNMWTAPKLYHIWILWNTWPKHIQTPTPSNDQNTDIQITLYT